MVPWKKKQILKKNFQNQTLIFCWTRNFLKLIWFHFYDDIWGHMIECETKVDPPCGNSLRGGGQVEIPKKDSYVLKRQQISTSKNRDLGITWSKKSGACQSVKFSWLWIICLEIISKVQQPEM